MKNTYEEVIAGKVLDVLKTKKYCNVPAKEFLQLWFSQTNRLNELQFTNKLLNFSRKNKLDYVIVLLGDTRHYEIIKFWKLKEKKKDTPLLLEAKNGQNPNDREEEDNGTENFGGSQKI